MNYEARIAALRAKGILDEEDATALQSTLHKKLTALPKKRSYTLEMIGIVLLGAIVSYLVLHIGMVESSESVENVSKTLNASRAGVSASHSFLLLLAGFLAVVLLGLYGLVHHYYNLLWRIEEEMIATGALITDLEVRQSDMDKKLQNLASQQEDRKGKTTKTAMEITKILDSELGEMQRYYAALQAECRQKRRAFPYTLAAMAGKLPECQ